MADNTAGSEEAFEAQYTTVPGPRGEAYWTLDQLIASDLPYNRVWTVIEAEGNLHILSGNHFVNRFAFVVTEEEWTTLGDTYVWALTPTITYDNDGVDMPTEPMAAEDAEECGAVLDWDGADWHCTRPPHAEGQHVAHHINSDDMIEPLIAWLDN